MTLINFTLTEHILEDKINEATKFAMSKTESKMQNDIIKKTKDLRKYMDTEFRKSQLALNGMQHDLDNTAVSIMKQGQDLAEMSMSHTNYNSSPMQGNFFGGGVSSFD